MCISETLGAMGETQRILKDTEEPLPMSNRAFEGRTASAAAGRYLDRLSKALPVGRHWSGRGGREFWPEGAKLVISISLQVEGIPQAERSVFPPVEQKLPDAAAAKLREYGFKEGIPRLLDVFQRRRVRATSHMAGAAVDRNPELAREIVERGHEGAIFSHAFAASRAITPEEERASIESDLKSVTRAIGSRPVGFHAFCLRRTPNTLEILQELGFLYHIDDVSRDEPFVIPVRSKPFVVVPFTIYMNDLVAYESRFLSTEQYAADLRNEFEMLYSESESRRRMMSISAHDYISGRPARAKVLEEFIIYAQRRPGVVFLRKDEIAKFALGSAITPREEEPARAADAA
jgi:peptidoglycan/xylan/chitin deacetylase (PgdA/CDA1 family)